MIDALVAELADLASGRTSRAERAGAIAARIVAATGVRWAGLYTVADRLVVNEAWCGPTAPAHPTFPVDAGLTSHALRTLEVVVSNDVAADPRYLTNQADSGSELIAPVVVNGRVVGTLDVESHSVGAFDEESVLLFRRLATAVTPLWRCTG